jgi:cystinosin
MIMHHQDAGSFFAKAFSATLGWLYFAAWTASFWPQALLIYRRKSVSGISLDFLSLNAFGFVCYSVFNLAFLLSKTVQQQYRNTHRGQEHLVRWNDAFFAMHAVALASWQFGAAFFYRRAPGQRISTWARTLLAILVVAFSAALAICIVGGGDDDSILRWIDFVNICSFIKLLITLIKYSPQIVLNYRRKSTQGFAIEGILLDMTGGVLSFLQLIIDAQIINHDWSDVTGDPGKLGLSLISLFFDVVIIVQHYILYRSPQDENDGERQPLLT